MKKPFKMPIESMLFDGSMESAHRIRLWVEEDPDRKVDICWPDISNGCPGFMIIRGGEYSIHIMSRYYVVKNIRSMWSCMSEEDMRKNYGEVK